MFNKLAQRLAIPLTLIVVIVAAFSGLFTITAEERQMLKAMTQSADQLSRGISSATWHAMLADRREDAYQVMETIALKQGIDRIRMFNRSGQVTFSTDPAEVRMQSEPADSPCLACHPIPTPPDDGILSTRMQIYRTAGGGRNMAMVTPILNEPSCSQALCHAHPKSDAIVGTLEVHHSLETVDSELSAMRNRVLIRVLVESSLITLCLFLFTRRFVDHPIHELMEAAQAISQMDLDRPVRITNPSEETERLATALDVMRRRLKGAMEEIRTFTATLESKVEDRTRQLKAAQQKLLQSDRLASLGTLAASVAHEINNPISGVLNLGALMQRILKDDGIPTERVPEFRRYLGQVTSETARVGRIVSDLLAFSRRGAPHRSLCDLNQIVQHTVSLVDHKLKLANIALELSLAAALPPIQCDGSQIQQVTLNLVLNAAEATQSHGGGSVVVATGVSPESATAFLSVRDDGEGIAEENLTRIFDPFFTTKASGKGVGLGLAVSYGIVQAHNGEIDVKSRVGEGTVFTVHLPLQPAAAPGPAGAAAA
jgi:two-component system NtrC family sensor kinase